MAMIKSYVLREAHTRFTTALGYNPHRREMLMGCEDGVIKVWEAESGKLVQTISEHHGWITDFLYWNDARLVLSAALDGYIIAWSAGGVIFDRVQMGQPVYSLALNMRRNLLICGVNSAILVFKLDENKDCGHIINLKVRYVARDHTDIVRCLVCHEMRVYSGGYDQKLIVYDMSYSGNLAIRPVVIHARAHDAGITCLIVVKEHDNYSWIVTGSFDKTVKVWSADGKPVHKLDGFVGTVTGVCYVSKNRTIWAVGGTSRALLFDLKSGENVSDFIGTFHAQEDDIYYLQVLKYFPEINQVVASTNRRTLIAWKYASTGCQTSLKLRWPIDSLCYTKKVPILLFSGDSSGAIVKWERMQANHSMYSKEAMVVSETLVTKLMKAKLLDNAAQTEEKAAKPMKPAPVSHYAYHKPAMSTRVRTEREAAEHEHSRASIIKIVFVEEFDSILAASEDGNIYVWGFDEDAVSVLKEMKPEGDDDLIAKYSVLLDTESALLPENRKIEEDDDSVTNRVAGFVCKFIFAEHSSCVTCMVVVCEPDSGQTFLLSGSWDRRLCIWDLDKGKLHDTFRNEDCLNEHVELASDGVITDMAYNVQRNEFAYSSSDKMVYIRRFSEDGSQMVLLNTLQGHEGEVTSVVMNGVTDKWITGSEDGTIRIWSTSGMNECEMVLTSQGTVSAMICDVTNGCIVAGVQEFIRVYDPYNYRLVQTNVGHTDIVRCIIHIPERNQYVSASWDKTVRIWHAWKIPRRMLIEESANKSANTSANKSSITSANTAANKSANTTANTSATPVMLHERESNTGAVLSVSEKSSCSFMAESGAAHHNDANNNEITGQYLKVP